MLTKKQIWRRTKSRRRTTEHETSEINVEQIPMTNISTDHHSLPSPSIPHQLKSILSHNNLTKFSKSSSRSSHTLRFSSTVHVLLIPSRLEILSQSLNIYYLTENYLLFKREAIQEIRETAKEYNLTIKLAMNFLYQPNYELPSTDSIVTLMTLSPPTQGGNKNQKEIVKNELKFLNDVKTDVELQEQKSQSVAAAAIASSSSSGNIVTRSGTASGLKHSWVVQWKQPSSSSSGANPNLASSLSTSSVSANIMPPSQ
jgi:hypothetical protein